MAKYQLTREGEGRTWGPAIFKSRRAALQFAGHSIVDNGHGSKREAQEWAAKVKDGEPAVFGPYVFMLVRA